MFQPQKYLHLKRWTATIVALVFLSSSLSPVKLAQAQNVGLLPAPTPVFSLPSSPLPIVTGLNINAQDAFQFDFIINK